MKEYDIIIIGAGPAGISASIYAVSRGKSTLVIEKDRIGGLIGKVSTVTDVYKRQGPYSALSYAGSLRQPYAVRNFKDSFPVSEPQSPPARLSPVP